MGDRGDPSQDPMCFMHIPKTAGVSVTDSLNEAFPAAAVTSRSDESVLCGFSDFDSLPADKIANLAVTDEQIETLADYAVVCGHISLPTLLRVAPATNVITVLREPRVRLLSTFLFFRLAPTLERQGEYARELLERPSESLDALLAAVRAAPLTDNMTCRFLLRGDPRLRDDRFIVADDVRGIADAALEALDRLGDVVLLEFDDLWARMSRFFEVALTPRRSNVAGVNAVPDGALPIRKSNMLEMLDLMNQRCAADRLVYEAVLARRCDNSYEARRMMDAVFADALVRFGDLTGTAATKLHVSPTSEQEDHMEDSQVEVSRAEFARPAGMGALGRDSYIAEPYKVCAPHRVHIGDNVVVGERLFLSLVQTDLGSEYEPQLRIGDDTEIGSDLFVHCTGPVEIGEAVRIGPRVFIGDSGRDYEDPSLRPGGLDLAPPAPVRIEDRAVIGAAAIVLEGVTIGEGAQVAPGSVVSRDVPPGSTAAGNPARVSTAPPPV